MSYVPLGWKNYGRLGKDRGRIFFELYWWPNGGKTVFLWEKSSPESEIFLMIYNFTSWIPIHPILQQKPSVPHQVHFPCFLLHPFQQSLPPFFKASWSFWLVFNTHWCPFGPPKEPSHPFPKMRKYHMSLY